MGFSEVQFPSNRKFGFFVSFVVIVVAAYFWWKGAMQLSIVLGVAGVVFALITILKDELLLPLNKLWMRLGLLLGMIVSPIVLGVMFFFLFTPISFLMRLFGRDELHLKKCASTSYWKLRETAGSNGDSFKYQF